MLNYTYEDKRILVKPSRHLQGEDWTRWLNAYRAAGGRFDRTCGSVAIQAPRLLETCLRETGLLPATSESRQSGLLPKGLFEHQVSGIIYLRFMQKTLQGALLADEMGLGKTAQALLSARHDRLIIVCPASVKAVWAHEIKKWRPDLTPRILSGKQTLLPLVESKEALILNYDILPPDALVTRPTSLIMDEAHALKNYKSKRSKAAQMLSNAVRRADGDCLLITATPLLSRPGELWTLLGVAGLSSYTFESWEKFTAGCGCWTERVSKDREVLCWGTPNDVIRDNLKLVMLRRTKAECLDLPKKRRIIVPISIDLAPEKELDAKAVEEAQDLAPLVSKLAGVRAKIGEAKAGPVADWLDDWEESDAGPIVVFAHHEKVISRILAGREGWARIDGATPTEERARIVEAFQAGKLKGIAASIMAAGVGITLTRAAACAFVELDWTPAINEQAIARVHRIGQERDVDVYIFKAENSRIDSHVVRVNESKVLMMEGAGVR